MLKVEWILISHRAVFCCHKAVSCCDRAVSHRDRAVSFGRAGRGSEVLFLCKLCILRLWLLSPVGKTSF